MTGSTSTLVIRLPTTNGSRSRRIVSTSGNSGTIRLSITLGHAAMPGAGPCVCAPFPDLTLPPNPCSLFPVITHLQGRLARMDVSGPAVEVDVQGVRYEVLVPIVLWPEIQGVAGEAELNGAAGPEIGLHIFYQATANNPTPVLVGFLRRAEREFFRKFTTVEGIGPAKAAKAMNISVSTIARAIEQEDRTVLSKMPGIGPRGLRALTNQESRVTLAASVPRSPCLTSNSTWSPSCRVRKPRPSMAEWCTNTSVLPSDAMKP